MNYDSQKYKQSRSVNFNHRNHLASLPSDPIEQERLAQQQEHQRRQGKGTKTSGLKLNKTKGNMPAQSKTPPKRSLEDNLARTNKWLHQTFPELFNAEEPIKPLDIHILRDLKQHYKQYQTRYPKDLVIKAALNRAMVRDAYLFRLKAGENRYTLGGNISGIVTEEEESKAIHLLGLPYEER